MDVPSYLVDLINSLRGADAATLLLVCYIVTGVAFIAWCQRSFMRLVLESLRLTYGIRQKHPKDQDRDFEKD
jgi:uncharacterized membrane protein YuzA (DUF378 family)